MVATRGLSIPERLAYAMPHRVAIFGATGLAKMVKPVLAKRGADVVAVYDRNPDVLSPWTEPPMFRSQEGFVLWRGEQMGRLGGVVCIAAPHGRVRLEFQDWLTAMGVELFSVLHETATIEGDVSFGEGVIVLAKAYVSTDVQLHQGAIVGEGSIVGHDSVMERGSQTGPGAVLCGGVTLAECAWVGAGATILPGLHIGENAKVGAGSVVTKDVPEGVTVRGLAAHIWEREVV